VPSAAQFRQVKEEKQRAELEVATLREERERNLRERTAERAANRAEIAEITELIASLERTQTINITAAKRAAEALRVSEATARSLFENVSQGIVTADRSGRIIEANGMMEILFGYGRTELIGASVEMLLPEAFRQAHAAHRADYAARPHARTMGQDCDLMARRKDGSEFPAEICLSYVTEHQSGGLAVAFISDVTARQQADRRLVVSKRELEHALARVKEESENKSSLASMSHELRTPLNSIIGFGEILLDRKAGEINALQEEFLSDCQHSARHLLSLIDDIIDKEKIAAGRRRAPDQWNSIRPPPPKFWVWGGSGA
jgi:protein-histidine pros-kinase